MQEIVQGILGKLNSGIKESSLLKEQFGNALYITIVGNGILLRSVTDSKTEEFPLVLKTESGLLGNSSRYFGVEESAVLGLQTELEKLIPMAPFSALIAAGLKVTTYKEVCSGGPETLMQKFEERRIDETRLKVLKDNYRVTKCEEVKGYWVDSDEVFYSVTYLSPRHFTGARLFTVSHKETGASSLYLMDLDRRELEHGIINPFLVQLPNNQITTIEEAYQSLKPSQVLTAEKLGFTVLRQGEWFFIPTNIDLEGRDSQRGELRAGPNRPNRVEKWINIEGVNYCKGVVEHDGREHADLLLEQWCVAVPNTAISSFTITGDID